MRIFIAAGGTGGHVFPSLSVAEEFRRLGKHEIFFLGTRRGLEASTIASKFPVLYVSARGWDRRFGFHTLRMVGENLLGCFTIGWYFLRYRPQVFLAMGSYLALLGALWARFFRIPIYLHEQNVYPGLANRIVARWAKRVFLAFEETGKYLKTRGEVEVTGNPLRREVMAWRGKREEARRILGLEAHRKTILVVGGSRGSSILNKVFLEALNMLPQNHLQVIHITGTGDHFAVSREAKKYPFPYLVFPFFESIGVAYAAADVALCRAGASTVTELFFFGLPSILVPYGEAADNHQWHNACWLAKHGCAVVLTERDFQAPLLAEKLLAFLEGPLPPQGGTMRVQLERASTCIVQRILEDFREERT